MHLDSRLDQRRHDHAVYDKVGCCSVYLKKITDNNESIHNVFHVSLLEPWPQRAGEEPTEPMPLAEDNGKWALNDIVDTKRKAGKYCR